MEKELDDLLTHFKDMTKEVRKIKGYGDYLDKYIFSSKKRDILFKISAPVDRTAETNKISDLCKTVLLPTINKVFSATKYCLNILESKKLFLQKHRQKETIRYLYSAIEEEKKFYRLVQDFEKVILQLSNENIDYKQMKSCSDKLHKIFLEWENTAQQLDNYLSHFEGVHRLENYVSQTEEQLSKYNLYYKNSMKYLQTGDILMSFKSLKYLKLCELKKTESLQEKVSFRISSWIKSITNSQVTHVALYLVPDPNKPETGRLFHSYGGEYRIQDIEVERHTLWIVLRPRMTPDQRMKLLQFLREKRIEKVSMTIKPFLGALISQIGKSFLSIFTKQHVQVNNAFANAKAQMFCSQFLNEAFKHAGIYLTPKSAQSGTVYPADIAASKDVNFLGVLFDSTAVESKDMLVSDLLAGVKV